MSVGLILAACAGQGTPKAGAGCRGGDTACTTSPRPIRPIAFPAKVSSDQRFIVDGNGKPYLLVGDSPQCLSTKLSTADMEFYFADRQAHGFNAAWVNLLCGWYTRGRSDTKTYDGIAPFMQSQDLATPNPLYFSRMDTMIATAANHGITLLLDPAETGSFRDLLKANGSAKSEAYGAFLGARYQAAKNIIWMLGNDYQPNQWEAYDSYESALSQGLRAADPSKLQIVELNYKESTSFDDPTWTPLMDLATSYTYFPTYDSVLRAYDSQPAKPVIMVEANYENENNTGGPKTTAETLRRQEYWTMLSGAAGQLYGHGGTWGFTDSAWKKHFDTPAVNQLGIMTEFFDTRDWQELVPDQAHSFLTGGGGTYKKDGDVLDSDYATAAITSDGTFGAVYVPTARTVTVDLTKLAAGTTARWFDPVSGALQPASSPFTTPGVNAGGDQDWLLVFDTGVGTTGDVTTTTTT